MNIRRWLAVAVLASTLAPMANAQVGFDNGYTRTSIISSTLALGAADSSLVLDTRNTKLGMLLIKAVVAGTGTVDTTTIVRLGIQVRTHIGGASDSSSTFAIYPYGVVPAMTLSGVTGSAADTSASGHLSFATPWGGYLATPSAQTAWSGEIVVDVMAKRNAHGNSIAINGHTFYYPSGIAIPLSSLFGYELYSPYTSIRVRNMSGTKAGAAFTTATVVVTVALVGSPL